MAGRQGSEFAADPITTKPLSKAIPPEPVSPPLYAENNLGSGLTGTSHPLLNSQGLPRDTIAPSAFQMGLSPALGGSRAPSNIQLGPEPIPAGLMNALPVMGPAGQDWQQQQAQLQQLVSQQAMLNQLQSKMQTGQGLPVPNMLPNNPQQPQLASLLSQQLHSPAMHNPLFPGLEVSRGAYPSPAVPARWPQTRSASSSFTGSPNAPALMSFPEPQPLRHSQSFNEDRKFSRSHGYGAAHSTKGRPLDLDGQCITLDKLRREVSRLQSEVDRLEKEVARQKSLRETERIEFTDAKDRVRHSWAVDRDDFARVKSLLKTKNAEHHAQSGRLSQQLKEAEAINRSLKELCTRHGIVVPPELEVTHSRRHSSSPGQRSSVTMPSLPSSQASLCGLSDVDTGVVSRTPSETSFDSDFLERLAAARVAVKSGPSIPASSSQPPSPVSPASAVMQMVQQLQHVVPAPSESPTTVKVLSRPSDTEELAPTEQVNSEATQAAAQAAAALSQLAAALSSNKMPAYEAPVLSRSSSPTGGDLQQTEEDLKGGEFPVEGLGQFPVVDTNLNRMSLQSWVKSSNRPSLAPSVSSGDSTDNAPQKGAPDQDTQNSKPGHDGAQFSLKTQSVEHPKADEEIKMWPLSPRSRAAQYIQAAVKTVQTKQDTQTPQ